MINFTDYNNNAQKAANQGMETFLNWQKQALENTLSMAEEGLAVQEKNLNETRQQYQNWEQNMNRELDSQKNQYKSMVLKFTETYWPESKNQFEQAEKLYEQNIGGMIDKTRDMVGSTIERNIETTLTFEKEWLNKLRENYTSGADNLRKQYDMMTSLQSEKKEASAKKPVAKPETTK
jgi:chemotaxis regulatin CheY-phosphate phosphatase CheZ|tara:strand:- start:915 stop:1448 length:534 start_codon:yes stop_codon:yes gene_type:complete